VLLLQRQRTKGDLAQMFETTASAAAATEKAPRKDDDGDDDGDDDDEAAALGNEEAFGGAKKNKASVRMSLTKKDVLRLLYPSFSDANVNPPSQLDYTGDTSNTSLLNCNNVQDSILLASMRQLGNKIILSASKTD
jgi:hypothetical protein